VPDSAWVFLKVKYTDITQNTNVQSSTVTEINCKINLYIIKKLISASSKMQFQNVSFRKGQKKYVKSRSIKKI
jgi:hypothetical protein